LEIWGKEKIIMKLLLFNYEYPPLGGGAGNSTMSIAKAYSKLGHDVLVVTTWFEGLPEEDMANNMKVLRVKSRRKRKDRSNPLEMLDYVGKTKKLKNIIKQFNPDFSIGFMALPSGLSSYYYFKTQNIPYIISVQGGDVPGFLPDIKSLRIFQYLSMPLTKKIWKNSIKVVANSRGLMQLAQKTGDKINIKTNFYPNGIDLNFFKPIDKKNEIVKILFVGRFYSQKGLNYLLESINILKESKLSKKFCLELVGDGPEKSMILSMVDKYKLHDYVKIIPWCNKEDLLKKYQNADLFVLSSHEEGMPNVISEAMACGLPIVSTRVRGSEELVKDGENGYLIEPKNSEQLADKIQKLIEDDALRNNFSKKSLEIISNYSWENVANYYIEVFKNNKNK